MQRNLEETLQWLEGFSKEVAFASTVHEPQQSLQEGLERIVPIFKEMKIKWYISATEVTRSPPLSISTPQKASQFWNLLSNFKLASDADLPRKFSNYNPATDAIEANHYDAQLRAARSGKRFVFYMDLDRVILGANYYPQEFATSLNSALTEAKQGKIVSLARSPHAINTHLTSLVLTEGLIHPFYNRELRVGNSFVDLLSTGWLAPADKVKQTLRDYKGGEFLGVRSNFPNSKVILAMMSQHGLGLHSLQTQQMLRYEAPEQMRGSGKINLGTHVWTPARYDEVTLASRGIQERIMQNPLEWQLRNRTVVEYLKVLVTLWMKPRNKESKELDELTRQILEIPPTTTAEGYKTKAIELSQRYASYS